MSRASVLALVPILAGATLIAQQPLAAPGALTGVAVDDVTGEPVRFARVSVTPGRGRDGVLTDAAGRFQLTDIPPGRYGIRATHPAYADGAWGRRTHPFGMFQFFDLQPAERAEGLVIRMQRLATLSGRVVDANGAPVVGAMVRVMGMRVDDGQGIVDSGHAVETMGFGRFQRQVVAGRYLVAVASPTIPDAKLRASGSWPTQFLSGGHTATQADVITLQPGDRRDLLFRLTNAASYQPIRGRVSGAVPTDLALGLYAESPLFDTGLPILRAAVQPDGTFTMASVPRGRYRLQTVHFPPAPMHVRMMGGNSFTWSGRDRVAVRPPAAPTIVIDTPLVVGDEPLDEVPVPLRTAARISGRVVFEGTAPAPDASVLATVPVIPLVTDRRPAPALPVASIDAGGRFQTAGLPPGRYVVGFLNLFQAGEWIAREPAVVTLDATDVDITVVMTNERSFVRGVVRDAAGAPRPDATVHVFPVDPALWRASPWEAVGMLSIVPDRYGRYEIPDLRPRDYHLVATTMAADPNARKDTFFASLIPRASRLTMTGSGTVLKDLIVQ